MLDDVEIWQEGDTNPTPFRDDLVRTLQRLRPGSLRMQLMGGCTVENCLSDRLHACKFSYGTRPGGWSGTVWWGIHEMYQLCEHVGANPWFTLPGTVTVEEMARFMEYVGARQTSAGASVARRLAIRSRGPKRCEQFTSRSATSGSPSAAARPKRCVTRSSPRSAAGLAS